MRHLVLICALYALIVALILPSSLFASGQPAQTDPATTVAEEPAPAPAEEPAAPELPAETTPTETTPAPEAETAPAPPPPAETTPAAPAPQADEAAAPPAEAAQAEDAADEGEARKKKKKVRARAAANETVIISDFEFAPPEITVQVGDEVTWTNDGPSSHSATADDGSFDTGVFGEGESRSVTFDEAGTFAYICTPHPDMEGTVVVEAAGSLTQAEEDLVDAEEDLAFAEDELAAADGLPDTGRDARVVALTGLLMLALGAVLRLRARSQS